MPLQETSGAASYDAFGGAATFIPKNYIEDVFSTWLYTGTGAAQTIPNRINLSGSGGLVWLKSRSTVQSPGLFDTNRGGTPYLSTDVPDGNFIFPGRGVVYNNNGFTNEAASSFGGSTAGNLSAYVSWTFRKQPRFFDVQTWTGTGVNRTITHNLDSVPGCIIVKRTNTGGAWTVYHRSLLNTQYITLNSSSPTATGTTRWNSTTPTNTVFSLGTDATVNASGSTYVAYLFAHNAGGFGLSGADNVISCGSYTGNNSATGPVITLGFEPQWLMIKRSTGGNGEWQMIDNLRGMPVGYSDTTLQANVSNSETLTELVSPTSTGFQIVSTSTEVNSSGSIYLYVAIRRGPMRVPTVATNVFGLNARTGTGSNVTVTGNAGVSDVILTKNRGAAQVDLLASRLTGIGYMPTSQNLAEVAAGTPVLQANPWDVMDGVKIGTTSLITNASTNNFINYLFDRAPGFMDVCCYTGTGVVRTITHNLQDVPQLMIIKRRNGNAGWVVYSQATNPTTYMYLNTTSAAATASITWNNTPPTFTNFTVGTDAEVNGSGSTFINYLFCSCLGVSRISSYSGGEGFGPQTIDCSFSSGPRFVLIKSTTATGNWYVWDSARGIVAGNDPYFLLNSSNAEVTTANWINATATGFIINDVSGNAINTFGVGYLYFAIA